MAQPTLGLGDVSFMLKGAAVVERSLVRRSDASVGKSRKHLVTLGCIEIDTAMLGIRQGKNWAIEPFGGHRRNGEMLLLSVLTQAGIAIEMWRAG